MALHMIKLCVGCDTVEDLIAWRGRGAGPWVMQTRQTPKRADEILDGGSLYWVMKGAILCRQKILGIETVGQGAVSFCEVTLSADVIRVAPSARRPFQGWRYLSAGDAPPDLSGEADEEIPPELARALREAGAW